MLIIQAIFLIESVTTEGHEVFVSRPEVILCFINNVGLFICANVFLSMALT